MGAIKREVPDCEGLEKDQGGGHRGLVSRGGALDVSIIEGTEGDCPRRKKGKDAPAFRRRRTTSIPGKKKVCDMKKGKGLKKPLKRRPFRQTKKPETSGNQVLLCRQGGGKWEKRRPFGFVHKRSKFLVVTPEGRVPAYKARHSGGRTDSRKSLCPRMIQRKGEKIVIDKKMLVRSSVEIKTF